MSNNNLRGTGTTGVEVVLNALQDVHTLKELDLSSNTLGVSYQLKEENSPPICILGDMLVNSSLEILDISHNQMEPKCAVSIAHGLEHTQTLKQINISGNPIGQNGMSLLI